MKKKIINEFSVSVYGELEKYSNVISKGRCRIFYRGANRNGTYITDEFAEKLISTVPYTPIKGIFDEESGDYTDHGNSRDLGRIYGVVPAEPNFSWEKHIDEDGVEREYACVDVLIYTALYAEAGKIPGKSQSMELYSKSIKGDWQVIDGKKYYVFEDACFLGLQALGDETEPCFEGAAFYSLYQSLKDMVERLESNYQNFQSQTKGGNDMPQFNFKLSDGKKHECLWSLLNTEFTEEGNWTVSYGICEVYDDYALVVNYADGTYERVYYTKNDETDSVEISAKKRCYIIDVTESELQTLNVVRQLNGDTYDKLDEKFNEINALNEKNNEFSLKVDELSEQNTTLISEREGANGRIAELEKELEEVNVKYSQVNESVENLVAERDSLASFKKNVLDNEKKAVIESYANDLTDEVISKYLAKLDDYTAEELDMQLTYAVKKSNPDMFKKHNAPAYIPKDEDVAGIETILVKYEKH